MNVKTFKQTCTCENCGNEAEMIITCTLAETDEPETAHPDENKQKNGAPKQKVKGSATCSHCGNEADIWVNL